MSGAVSSVRSPSFTHSPSDACHDDTITPLRATRKEPVSPFTSRSPDASPRRFACTTCRSGVSPPCVSLRVIAMDRRLVLREQCNASLFRAGPPPGEAIVDRRGEITAQSRRHIEPRRRHLTEIAVVKVDRHSVLDRFDVDGSARRVAVDRKAALLQERDVSRKHVRHATAQIRVVLDEERADALDGLDDRGPRRLDRLVVEPGGDIQHGRTLHASCFEFLQESSEDQLGRSGVLRLELKAARVRRTAQRAAQLLGAARRVERISPHVGRSCHLIRDDRVGRGNGIGAGTIDR